MTYEQLTQNLAQSIDDKAVTSLIDLGFSPGEAYDAIKNDELDFEDDIFSV